MSATVLIAAALLAPPFHLRAGEAAPAGEVVRIDAAGVWLGRPGAGGAPASVDTLIGWDRVRAVEGDLADEAARFAVVADLAWRARTRLERGDATAAEPLFEELFVGRAGSFEGYRARTGPTAAMIAEGLLRCRLRRGAHVAAVEPWLALLASRAAGAPGDVLHADWAAEAGLAPVLDPATSLVPALPPIWVGWPSVQAFAAATSEAVPPGDTGAPEVLAALYAQSARYEAGLPAVLPEAPVRDPAALLCWQIVASRLGDPDQRAGARRVLAERIRLGAEPWTEAWCRAAIGRSLLREPGVRERQLGIIELLHLPARFDRVHPYLAGLALAEASVALRELGDGAGADRLLRELAQRYPDHPAFDWEPIRSRSASAGAPPARPAPDDPVLPTDPAPTPPD